MHIGYARARTGFQKLCSTQFSEAEGKPVVKPGAGSGRFWCPVFGEDKAAGTG